MSSLTGQRGFGATGSTPMGAQTGSKMGSVLGGAAPKGYEAFTQQMFTPEQMQLFQHLFSNVGPESFLSKLAGGDEGTFAQIERPAMQQFAGLQGGLASRFSGMGMGARHSSGFQNAATAGAQDFATQLQSQRAGLQQQALRDLMSMSGDLLNQRPYETEYFKKPLSFGEQFMGALAPGLSKTAGRGLFGSDVSPGALGKLFQMLFT